MKRGNPTDAAFGLADMLALEVGSSIWQQACALKAVQQGGAERRPISGKDDDDCNASGFRAMSTMRTLWGHGEVAFLGFSLKFGERQVSFSDFERVAAPTLRIVRRQFRHFPFPISHFPTSAPVFSEARRGDGPFCLR